MIKIGLKDRKLLYWLDQNSRAKNKELGKKVGLTEQSIGYKIKKLQEEGVIKKFVTFINTLSLGYIHYKVFIKLHNATEEIEDKIIKNLVANKNIRWVVSTSGMYDLSFSILAKDNSEFLKIFQRIESKFGKYMIDKNIVINVFSPEFTRGYLIDCKESKILEYKTSKEMQKIDEIDKKILKSISQNSRKNIVDISKEIKETIDIIKYRLKKLKEKNIINGFTLQLDLEKIGYEYYTIFLNLHNFTENVQEKILQFAKFHPNILFVVKVIGNYDLQLEIEVKNHRELQLLFKNFRKQFAENIRNFEILRVTKEYKYDFYPF